MHKRDRQVVGIEHIGSAHADAERAGLMEVARQRLLPGHDTLDLTAGSPYGARVRSGPGAGGGTQVAGMSSRVLSGVLAVAYERLGFVEVSDATCRRLVLARITEMTSKAGTIRVLTEIVVTAPSLPMIFPCWSP